MTVYAPEIQFREYAGRAAINADSDRRTKTFVFNSSDKELDILHGDGTTRTYISASALYNDDMDELPVSAYYSGRVECYNVHLKQDYGISMEGEEGSWASPEVEIKFNTSLSPNSLQLKTLNANDGVLIQTNAGPIKLNPNSDAQNGDIRIQGPWGVESVGEYTSATNFSMSADDYGRNRWKPGSAPAGTVVATLSDGWFDGQLLIIENLNDQDASSLELATTGGTDPIDGVSIAAKRVGIVMWLDSEWVPMVAWS